MKVKDIVTATHNAVLAGQTKVLVNVTDLVTLIEYMDNLKYSNERLRDNYNSCKKELNSISLDTYV